MKLTTQKERIFLFLILLIGFLFRVTMVSPTFFSSDDAYHLSASLDLFSILEIGSFHDILSFVYRTLSYKYGFLYLMLNWINLISLSLLNINLTEYTVLIPSFIIGTTSIFTTYLLGKRLFQNAHIGLLAAGCVAISPVYIQFSRNTSNMQHLSYFLFTVVYLLFLIYLKKNKYPVLFSLLLGFYVINDSQGLMIIPFLLISMILLDKSLVTNKSGIKETIVNSYQMIKTRFMKLSVVIPFILIFGLYVLVSLYAMMRGTTYGGYVGHLFARDFTLFNTAVYQSIPLILGFPLFILVAVSLVYIICRLHFNDYKLKKYRRQILVFMSLFLLYTLPWFLFIGYNMLCRSYFMIPTCGLIFLASMACHHFFLSIKQITRIMILPLIVVLFLLQGVVVVNAVYGNILPFLHQEGYYGTYYSNNGLKSAGYFFRQNFGKETKVISEFGMPAIKYYFNVNPLGDADILWGMYTSEFELKYNYVNSTINYNYINSTIIEAHLVILKTDNYKKYSHHLNQPLHVIAEVYAENKSVVTILAKEKKKYVRIDVEKVDHLFDEKYGNWESLYIKDYFIYYSSELAS